MSIFKCFINEVFSKFNIELNDFFFHIQAGHGQFNNMGSQIGSQIGRKKRSVMYMNGMTMTTAPHSYGMYGMGMGMPMMPTYARPYSPSPFMG